MKLIWRFLLDLDFQNPQRFTLLFDQAKNKSKQNFVKKKYFGGSDVKNVSCIRESGTLIYHKYACQSFLRSNWFYRPTLMPAILLWSWHCAFTMYQTYEYFLVWLLRLYQGRRKVWKSGGAYSTMMDIFCPPGWDRVNCSDKNWGGGSKPQPPHLRQPCRPICFYEIALKELVN